MPRSQAEWNSRFKTETRKHLADMQAVLNGLSVSLPETGQATDLTSMRELNPDVYTLFRLAHTIKGLAAMLGRTDFAEVAEGMEVQLGEALFNPVSYNNAVEAEVVATIAQLEDMTAQIEG